jgi:hypothetical protein
MNNLIKRCLLKERCLLKVFLAGINYKIAKAYRFTSKKGNITSNEEHFNENISESFQKEF